jgi:hypothetical protein
MGMRRAKRLGAALLFCTLAAGTAGAEEKAKATGIEGVAAFRGDFLAEAVVMAFPGPGPGREDVPVATAPPTDDSGRYSLTVPPGSYYLLAVKRDGDPWPLQEGAEGFFCYYLGNPIIVEEGKMTRVGFNMVRMGVEEEPLRGERSGISGRLLFEDDPLGRAYVHVYRDGSTNFRGMGMAAIPTGAEGLFRVKLPPGNYYLLARKRLGGGMYGPPGKNDYIGYYFGNPVEVRSGEFRQVALETTTRVDLIEEIWFTEEEGAGWFRGNVADADGNPVEGLYVLFYDDKDMTGAPVFVAGPTGAGGKFKVRAAEGKYYLLARSNLGGPPEAGERYGKYRGQGGEVRVDGMSGEEVSIIVDRYGGP